ncbi:hypothetical protein AB0D59_48275 [Streptomyces sp. NPDC048417]|uniref:hypothetical protein n=1 Tax=Streptomyces sp. NPDC048417 TaxID=3155387 RepID=UPI00342E5309
MSNGPLYGGPYPLCRRPLRIEYGRTRHSAQLDHPARVWITGYRCASCEATRPEQWTVAMRDRYEDD